MRDSIAPRRCFLKLLTIEGLVVIDNIHMFSRINQVARHLSRPLPNYLHNSAARPSLGALSTSQAMAQERSKKMIHTAACLIIGDEVLGGKVCDLATYSRHPFSLRALNAKLQLP